MTATDRICVRGLRAFGYHGVFEHERRDGQEFVVDAVLELDAAPAATSDALADTVDYGALAQALADVVAGEPVALLETLAERLAAVCLDAPGPAVRAVDVTVHKPSAPVTVPVADVSVTVRRHAGAGRRGARRAVLALGSNLGDRAAHLRRALVLLAAHDAVAVERVSGVYETDPVGGPPQPPYLNAVAEVATDVPPGELLAVAHVVEAACGRDRAREVRWGPRTLDLDLIVMGELAVDRPGLSVPHPRAAQRAFVLAPWAELDPAAVLPGRGRVVDLLAGLDTSGVRRVGALDSLVVPA